MISEGELRQMYWDEEMSQSAIAEEVGVCPSTINRWMRLYDIGSRTTSESLSIIIPKISREEIEEMYWVDQMSTAKIGKELGMSQGNIIYLMKKYGIDSRTLSESKHTPSLINMPKISKPDLEKMYIDNQMSMAEIAKEVNTYKGTVCRWMAKYGIEPRTNSESQFGKFIGEKNGNWRGGISFEPYCNKFNDEFKEAVRIRDDYVCQLCGCNQNDRKLDVHHIHYDKENCYPDVVALCRSCHTKTTSGDRDYWEQYFEDLLIERGLFNWSMGVS